MRFNLVHVIPNAHLHGLYGYLEVIETIRWGLSELGHQVACLTNQFGNEGVNIVFGCQMLDEATLAQLPANMIFYNLEQLANTPPEKMTPALQHAAKRFQIWDYDQRNIEAIKRLQPTREPVRVPIGFSPTISRIPKRAEEDIDVLLYGVPSAARLRVIAELAEGCMKTMYVCGLYGAARDELISRAKIVLNVNRYEQSRVFELVRVSYLMANAKAVVSDLYPESEVEPDIKSAVAFAPLEKIAIACAQLLDNEPTRRRLEAAAQQVMQRRDIRPILQTALQQSALP